MTNSSQQLLGKLEKFAYSLLQTKKEIWPDLAKRCAYSFEEHIILGFLCVFVIYFSLTFFPLDDKSKVSCLRKK